MVNRARHFSWLAGSMQRIYVSLLGLGVRANAPFFCAFFDSPSRLFGRRAVQQNVDLRQTSERVINYLAAGSWHNCLSARGRWEQNQNTEG